jgi:hypothetical protein
MWTCVRAKPIEMSSRACSSKPLEAEIAISRSASDLLESSSKLLEAEAAGAVGGAADGAGAGGAADGAGESPNGSANVDRSAFVAEST